MRKILQVTLMIGLWLFQSMATNAQDTLTNASLSFEKALEISFSNSHVIKQSQIQVKGKEQALKGARGLYLPKIGVNADYVRMSDDLTMDFTPMKDAISPLYSTLGNYGVFSGVPNPAGGILPDAYSTKAIRTKLLEGYEELESQNWEQTIQKKEFATVMATAQWPLYAGGKVRIANKVAKIEKQEADNATVQKQGELTTELVERYFGLCLAKQAVKVREDVLYGVSKHLSDAEDLQKNGLIATADVLQAKLYYSNADREYKKAKRNVENVNQALLNTLAIENDSTINPTTELFYLDTIEPVDYFKKLAMDKNPSLMQVEDKKLLVKQNLRYKESDYLPTLAAIGTYNLWDKNLTEYSPKWIVGLTLNYTIFDGATRYRKIREASFKEKEIEEVKLKVESDLSTVINKLYNEMNVNYEQLVALESSMAFAEELVRVREKAFHENMSNSTEVVDAQLTLAQVRIDRLQAMYNYDLCLARILQYAGIPDQFASYEQRPLVKTESYKSIK